MAELLQALLSLTTYEARTVAAIASIGARWSATAASQPYLGRALDSRTYLLCGSGTGRPTQVQ
jgi:hypothetical protein